MKISEAEVLSLGAAIQAIYITVTLEARALDHIQDCHALWAGIASLFNELCACWSGADSNDPAIAWLRQRLRHFQTLTIDQTQLYEVTTAERLRHAKNREDLIETYSQRNDNVPADTLDQPSPAHVYRLAPMP